MGILTTRGAQAGARNPFPTPTTPVDSLAACNAALACRPSAPAPQPGVLYTGLRPGAARLSPKEVALTFDDGPTPYTSPPIFTSLEQSRTPATFFVEGQYIHQWPNPVQREWNDGFAIGIHTWDHPLIAQQSTAQVHHQFADSLNATHSILQPGALVLMHDGPALREQTAALPLIMEGSRVHGLLPVTLPCLLANGRYPDVSVATPTAGAPAP